MNGRSFISEMVSLVHDFELFITKDFEIHKDNMNGINTFKTNVTETVGDHGCDLSCKPQILHRIAGYNLLYALANNH